MLGVDHTSTRPAGIVATGRRANRRRIVLFALVILVILVAVLAPVLAPDSPNAVSPLAADRSPSLHHLLGTDAVGRDLLSRIIYGARVSLFIGLVSTLLSLVAGGLTACIAVATGKWGDAIVMRCVDVLLAFPAILLAVVWGAAVGTGVLSLLVIISILHLPQFARIVRSSLRAELGELYVTAERTMGASNTWIIARHVVRNVAGPSVVFGALMVADAIALEASLSFIGVGISPPTSSWGNIVADGQALMLSGTWWPITFGGIAIVLAVLLFTAVAESLDVVGGRGEPASRRPRKQPAAAAGDGGRTETQPRLQPSDARPDSSRAWDASPDGLVSVRHLSIRFPQTFGNVPVLNDVSFSIARGEVLGVVGESGCGKTLAGLSIMGLLPEAAQTSGEILFGGQNILSLRGRQRRRLLGSEIAMVYQDALSSLNPTMKISSQLHEVCRKGSRWSAPELIELVGLSDVRRVLRSYPSQLSGGQRQRVLIALALSRGPQLLVADEPTTALDVTVQAQILELISSLRRELGFAMLLISHDLAMVKASADRVLVLYAGANAETGPAREIVAEARHPYTEGLLQSIRSLEEGVFPIRQLPGTVPSPRELPSGCRFAGRCARELPECATALPAPASEGTHVYACHNPLDLVQR
jgi:peptide/nickel transport system permease protein